MKMSITLKKSSLVALSLIVIVLMTGCQKVSNRYALINGGFETGDLTGWTITGESFSGDVITDQTTYGPYHRFYFHEGTYHLVGSINRGKTGTLKSSEFIVSNTGYLTFLIAGGFNYNKVYVGLYDAKTDELLDKRGNTMFKDPEYTDGYVRVIWDASSYLGRRVYLKIVDTDESDYYDYINVDDFKVNLTEDELASYRIDALIRVGVIDENNKLQSVQRYVDMNLWKIDNNKRFNYHAQGQIGWINDPNGFVYFNNKYHLFYQHNPMDVVWGPMHWGHVVSDDLIKWDYLPIALAPDKDYDRDGVFSGSAIEKDRMLYLFYTGNTPGKQVQALAYSKDGVNFEKYEGNPIIDERMLPPGASVADFRDPKVWEHEGQYYMIIGSRQVNGYGQVLLYRSQNLMEWEFVGITYKGSEKTLDKLGRMWECPDLFNLDGQDILIMSPQQVPGHRNENATVYIVGNLDYQTGKLNNINYDAIREIDYGFDFYAPQTMIDPKGRRIMVAWMQSWNRTPVTASLGFSGALTLPRVLSLKNGILYQQPVPEIENYRRNPVHTNLTLEESSQSIAGFNGQSNEIILNIKNYNAETGVKLFKGTHEETKVYIKDGFVYLDRTNGTNGKVPKGEIHNITRAPLDHNENEVTLRIFIDKYSVEVFINGGAQTITSTVFPSEDATGIEFYSLGKAEIDVTGYDLIIR